MRILPVALVALLLVALAGCGGGTSDAASVNGQKISEEEFQKELDAIADNEALAAEADKQGVTFVVDGQLSPELQATWLTEVINSTIVSQGVKDEGIEVTDADREQAEQGVINLFGSEEVFDAFPKWFQDLLVERQAELVALSWSLLGGRVGDDEAAQRAFFEERIAPSETQYCARHILVETEETANEVAAQARNGGDFAALAAEYSGDPGSKDSGGDLGCNPSNMFVTEFADALERQTPGEVGDPFESDFGWHIVLVDSVQAPTFEEMAESIDLAIQGYARTETQTWMAEQVEDAKVSINTKYGTLVQQGGSIYVTPPETPTTLTPDPGTIDTAPNTVPSTEPSTEPATEPATTTP